MQAAGLPNPTRFLGTGTRISVQESKKILDAPRLLHAWRIHKTAVLDAVVATIPSTPLMQHWLKS